MKEACVEPMKNNKVKEKRNDWLASYVLALSSNLGCLKPSSDLPM
jgi:hypothetical protein